MTIFSTKTKSLNGSASTEGKPAEGLSRSDKIALGVGLGIGLASLIVGVLSLATKLHKRNHVPLDANSGGNRSG